jgi:hypothetical protein
LLLQKLVPEILKLEYLLKIAPPWLDDLLPEKLQPLIITLGCLSALFTA